MKKKVKFNQCQDCGCTGAQLMLVAFASNEGAVICPYCRRHGAHYALGKYGADPAIEVIVESWNIRNRDNEEGLA